MKIKSEIKNNANTSLAPHKFPLKIIFHNLLEKRSFFSFLKAYSHCHYRLWLFGSAYIWFYCTQKLYSVPCSMLISEMKQKTVM